ncbi:MAG TPA: hypothetical protein VGO92_00410, partial [Acidimicrobiales bacterium]|nr:hypothetical protein [Acidimicrobiales bacterium]
MRPVRPTPALAAALALAPLAALAALALGAWPAAAADHAVTIKDFSFTPGSVTVQAGDRVVWTNTGQNTHSAVDDAGTFDTGGLAPGQSKALTFNTAGTF